MRTLQSMFNHMAWADARVLDLLTANPQAVHVPNVLKLLSHVIAAERVWLLRLRGEDSSSHPIWPEWTLEHARTVAADNARAYEELAAELTDESGGRVVEYRNSQGTAFRTQVADILSQVTLHGSYHRGQIAAALRASGVAPVNTDFITFVRERGAATR
ncbi:MAG: damage-inducible protein DinB [Acidobacteria bacterium]|nr:damage-inducible protein DinB [Acidobacteriota bacterium]